ncbi:MAG: hypothetical protein MJ252_12425, partial [archaeon]|nr:hypothetical protein [archaeon]
MSSNKLDLAASLASNKNLNIVAENIEPVNKNELKPKKIMSIEEIPKTGSNWTYMENILRKGFPEAFSTDLVLSDVEVYSLPEQWGNIPVYDDYHYVVKFSDYELYGGKKNEKQQTAEEMKEEFDKKNAKVPEKKRQQEPFLTEEKLFNEKYKEQKDKEEENAETCAALPEEDKFYYNAELKYVGPWIDFIMEEKVEPEPPKKDAKKDPKKEEEKSNQQSSDKNYIAAKKEGEKLIIFENEINTKEGTILQLEYLQKEAEKDKSKKPVMSPKDFKPEHTVAWVDLHELHQIEGLTKTAEKKCHLLLKTTYESRIELLKELTEGKDIEFNPILLKEKIKQKRKEIEEMKKMKKEIKKEEIKEDETPVEAAEGEEEGGNDLDSVLTKIDELLTEDYLEKARTYIKLIVTLSEPVNPFLPINADKVLPTPFDLIKHEEKTLKKYTNEDRENDLIKQFKIAILAIAKVYNEKVPSDDPIRRREKGINQSQKMNDTISKFLQEFNQMGRANLLKEKLKKFIVSIVRENFGKKGKQVKGVKHSKEDQFYSELYAYLTTLVAKATDELVALEKDKIHDDILVSYNQTKSEITNYISGLKGEEQEPEDKRLMRLSNECELVGNYDKALKYYKAILKTQGSKDSWIKFFMLAKKSGNKSEILSSLENAITMDKENEDLELEIIYAGNIYLNGVGNYSENIKRAYRFLTLLLYRMFKGLSKQKATQNLYAFLSFLHSKRTDDLQELINELKPGQDEDKKKEKRKNKHDSLVKKYFAAAKLMKIDYLKREKPEELQKPIEEEPVDPKAAKGKANVNKDAEPEEKDDYGNYNIHSNYKPPQLTTKQEDEIWFDLVGLFNKYNFYEISKELLERVNPESKEDLGYKICLAETSFHEKNYSQAIEISDEIIKINCHSEQAFHAFLLKGNSFYLLGKFDEAEECYIKAIRYKPQEIPFADIVPSLTKLGLIYIKQKCWDEAKVIFSQIKDINPRYAFAWLYLGISLTELKEYDDAKDALSKANELDVDNPVIWAYLTIYSLATNQINMAMECFNELMKVQFSDEELLKKIAAMFEEKEQFEFAANIYQRLKMNNPSDAKNYIQIANIYFNKMRLRKNDAISILNEGLKSVFDNEGKEEIKKTILMMESEIDDFIVGNKNEEKNSLNISFNNSIEKEEKGIENDQNFQEIKDISVIKKSGEVLD